jgi:DNA-binding transcriptional MocR family regulator
MSPGLEKTMSDWEWICKTRELCEQMDKHPVASEIADYVGVPRGTATDNLQRLHESGWLARSVRFTTSRPGEPPFTYWVPESEPPLDDSDDVWVTTGHSGHERDTYHITTDCQNLTKADALNRKRLALLPAHYELCLDCSGEASTGEWTEFDCPKTGCDESVQNLPRHLKYHDGGGD